MYDDLQKDLPGVTLPGIEQNVNWGLLREYRAWDGDINTLKRTRHPMKEEEGSFFGHWHGARIGRLMASKPVNVMQRRQCTHAQTAQDVHVEQRKQALEAIEIICTTRYKGTGGVLLRYRVLAEYHTAGPT